MTDSEAFYELLNLYESAVRQLQGSAVRSVSLQEKKDGARLAIIRALEANVQPQAVVAQPVPQRKTFHVGGNQWGWEGEFNRGWNACLDALSPPRPSQANRAGDAK